jgi:nucleoid-associated protein YgaU
MKDYIYRFAAELGAYLPNSLTRIIISQSFKSFQKMKKIFMTLTAAVLTANVLFAQAPAAAKPAVAAAQAVPAKVATAAQAAPVKAKKAAAVVAPAAETAKSAADAVVTKPAMAAKHTAHKAAATTGIAKMSYTCPKGDALSDGACKCPKCGAQMVPMTAAAATKKATKKAEMAPVVKKEEKKG